MEKNNLSLALSATALVIATAAGGPAIARAIVPNADKVDGIHAVKSTATVKARKGKLVATSSKTGLLPNNIIKTAPDAAKLGGAAAAGFRSVSLQTGAADPVNGAVLSGGGALTLPSTSEPHGTWIVTLPASYRAGDPLTADFWVLNVSASACSAVFPALALKGNASGQTELDVKVNPRFGRWDPERLSVVPGEGGLSSPAPVPGLDGPAAPPVPPAGQVPPRQTAPPAPPASPAATSPAATSPAAP